MPAGLLTAEKIADRLRDRSIRVPVADPFPTDYFSSGARAASVLVPLVREAGEWRMLFIRRTVHVQDRHSGQVAFPGGKVDPVDRDGVEAALRECQEEIGVDRDRIRVLGCLDDYRTVSNFLVTPVVATLEWPLELQPDETEVDRVFTIPMRWLADPANVQIRERLLPEFDVSIPVYYYQRYDGELLWGITAKITASLLIKLGFSLPFG